MDLWPKALGASLVAVALMSAPALAQAPAAERQDALCRRAPTPVVLPPERSVSQPDTAPRAGALFGAPPPSSSDPVAPPTSTDAPAPSPSASGEEIVVTGSRRDGSSERPAMRSRARRAERGDAAAPPESAGESRRGSAFQFREPRLRAPQPGVLTAGDHDDLLNPELYAHYVDGFLARESLSGVPRVDTGRVLTIVVHDGVGRPVPFAEVTLTCADGNELTLAAAADGSAVFFPALDSLGARVSVSVNYNGRTTGEARSVSLAGQGGAQRQVITLGGGADPVRRFDLALMVDTTGSMADELEYLKSELSSILADLKREHAGLDIRVALVVYRDTGDEYVTRTFPFTDDIESLRGDLARQRAHGGGDEPEAVEQALARTIALAWRPDAVRSVLFVADAPPHADDVAGSWRSAEIARAKRIHIVPVASSGANPGAEYMMRAMAALTQSRYIFLTDDSGVGNPHAPPSVDCFLVTKLDALIRRVLDSQISGRRVEPRESEIIRSVGAYDNGRCVGAALGDSKPP